MHGVLIWKAIAPEKSNCFYTFFICKAGLDLKRKPQAFMLSC